MKRLFAVILLFITFCSNAQDMNVIVNPAAIEHIERVLASDAMRGRATFSPEIDSAAYFIEAHFKASHLQIPDSNKNHLQRFSMVNTKPLHSIANLGGTVLPEKAVAVVSAYAHLSVNENSSYEKAFIKPGDNFNDVLKYLFQAKKNYVVFIDTAFAKVFPNVANFGRQDFKSSRSVVLLLTSAHPVHFSITIEQEVSEKKLANVVGVLPGKSKKDELVIFSAHYDHLGIGPPDIKGDSIYNGANDNASGVAAVLLLARYFAKQNANERTLVFVAFTGEEIGEWGSRYFSAQIDPAKVVAMFNIDMIGTRSKWGKNSAYLTGFEKSDMGRIMNSNLSRTQFTFHPDPYPEDHLFYRSDNAMLARLGIPAHTISTAKSDSEDPHYHQPSDEIGTLDIKNMTQVIKAIAISARSIIAGLNTPSRIK